MTVVAMTHFSLMQSIIAYSMRGEALSWDGLHDYAVDCCDLFVNMGNNLPPAGADSSGLMLQASSPCADQDECGVLGALPVGCAR